MARRVQGQKAPDGAVKWPRPLKPARPTQRPTGPKMFRPGTKPMILNDWMNPPPGFLNGNNSLSEWLIYKSLTLILGPEQNGAWQYQGKINAQLPGGAKPDFVVTQSSRPLALRVQTERFHIAVSSFKQFNDDEQRIQLGRQGYDVCDIYEEHYINDETGKAALKVTNDCLNGRQRANPIRQHTSLARG